MLFRSVPEFQSLDRLIARFRQTRTQWAAVVDEFGGFVGLITLEDVVEQMVGEIYEPHDTPREMVERLAADEYRVAGDIAIMDWEEAFDVSRARLVELHQRTSTLAGLLASLLKRIPKPGDQVRLTQFTLENGRLLLAGEASDIAQAYSFLEKVKKSALLQNYDWTSRQPQLAGKNKVRFEMEGARPDAQTRNE